MFNQDITIVNKWFNTATKKEEYNVHPVKGFWSSNESISINKTTLMKNDGVIVRILMSEPSYKSPKEYQENPTNSWTLKNDDYIVKGIIESVDKIAELKDNYEAMKITSVSVKDYGSNSMQHYEVSGA